MKRDFLIVASNNIYMGDGYASRIRMEIEILKDYFNVYVLIPSNEYVELEFEGVKKIVKYKRHDGVRFRKMWDYIEIRHRIKEVVSELDDPIVCGEALISSFMVCNFLGRKELKIIFDCHGTEPNEIALRKKGIYGKVIKKVHLLLEKRVAKRANAIVTVTNEQYKILHTNAVNICLPMLPAEHFLEDHNYREEIRQKLNIDHQTNVYVYSGGNQSWQMCDTTIKIYKQLEAYDKNSMLLIFSQATEFFSQLLQRYDIQRYKILSVDYADMPRYLDACDYGFCIRENNIVNRVASPTKILEYLARNVKPIITPYIGDYSKILQMDRMACVVEPNSTELKKLIFKKESFNGREYVKIMRKTMMEDYINALQKI